MICWAVYEFWIEFNSALLDTTIVLIILDLYSVWSSKDFRNRFTRFFHSFLEHYLFYCSNSMVVTFIVIFGWIKSFVLWPFKFSHRVSHISAGYFRVQNWIFVFWVGGTAYEAKFSTKQSVWTMAIIRERKSHRFVCDIFDLFGRFHHVDMALVRGTKKTIIDASD